jgi:hypothetical protein
LNTKKRERNFLSRGFDQVQEQGLPLLGVIVEEELPLPVGGGLMGKWDFLSLGCDGGRGTSSMDRDKDNIYTCVCALLHEFIYQQYNTIMYRDG